MDRRMWTALHPGSFSYLLVYTVAPLLFNDCLEIERQSIVYTTIWSPPSQRLLSQGICRGRERERDGRKFRADNEHGEEEGEGAGAVSCDSQGSFRRWPLCSGQACSGLWINFPELLQDKPLSLSLSLGFLIIFELLIRSSDNWSISSTYMLNLHSQYAEAKMYELLHWTVTKIKSSSIPYKRQF